MGDYAIKLESVGPDTQKVGQKAKRIGGMLAAGLPVPAGFVLTTEAYVKFLRHNKIANRISGLLEECHSSGLEKVREVSSQVQDLIMKGSMPDFLEREMKEEYQDLSIGREAKEIGGAALDLIRAGRDNVFVTVRPSPTSGGVPGADFTGQMRTLLSVRGHSQISYAIKECWASLFSLRAILYRRRKRIRDMPAMGVIIQKAVEPDKAGFAYTCVPETGDQSHIVVEGSWGFSGSMVDGGITPDEYLISKDGGGLASKRVRRKTWMMKRNEMTGRIEKEPVFRERIEAQLLDAKERGKLLELALRSEKQAGGHPQEVEWALERGRFLILDSFPVSDYGISPQPPGGIGPETGPLVTGIPVYRGDSRGRVFAFSSMSDLESLDRGLILVSRMTVPEIVPYLDRFSGMILDEGARSSHGSILAREFGIPCIVSAERAMSVLSQGQEILMDAHRGRVYGVAQEPAPGPPPPPFQDQVPYQAPGAAHHHGIEPAVAGPDQPASDQVPDAGHMAGSSEEAPQESGAHAHPDADSARAQGGESSAEDDGITATGMKVMISVPSQIGDSPRLSDGVGIVRAEHLITEKGKHPYFMAREDPQSLISSLVSGLGAIARAFYPKPVWFRSIDVRTDEFRELEGGNGEPAENNPMLGWHGVRRSLDQPGIIRAEIEVIKRLQAEGLGNLALGLPFVSSVDELRAVKQMAGPSVRVGVMIETPASGLDIEGFCREGIAFAAIGLSDLAQLVLGVDRENSKVSRLYSELSPGVMNLLKHVLRTCRKHSVETSVYGDFSSDSKVAEALVSLGVGSISTEPGNLEQLKSVISRTERRIILESMRKSQDPG